MTHSSRAALSLLALLALAIACDHSRQGLSETPEIIDYRRSTIEEPARDLPVDSVGFMVSSKAETVEVEGDQLLVKTEKRLCDQYEGPCRGTLFYPFRKQHPIRGCSATLVQGQTRKYIITAAHCVQDNWKIEDIHFVMGRTIHSGIATPSTDDRQIRVPRGRWFTAECVESGDFNGSSTPDWIVFRLTEEPEFEPISLGDPEDQPGTKRRAIHILGHPGGLPLKHIKGWLTPTGLEADNDGGNSGAALLASTKDGWRIVGVLRGLGSTDRGCRSYPAQRDCTMPACVCERSGCPPQPYTELSEFTNWETREIGSDFRQRYKTLDFCEDDAKTKTDTDQPAPSSAQDRQNAADY